MSVVLRFPSPPLPSTFSSRGMFWGDGHPFRVFFSFSDNPPCAGELGVRMRALGTSSLPQTWPMVFEVYRKRLGPAFHNFSLHGVFFLVEPRNQLSPCPSAPEPHTLRTGPAAPAPTADSVPLPCRRAQHPRLHGF